jgi:uncharacterized protein YlbG (UPF0298 family)
MLKIQLSSLEVSYTHTHTHTHNQLRLFGAVFYTVDQFQSSALYCDQWATGCEALSSFVNESAYLTAGNIRNEAFTFEKSLDVLKILSIYT